MKGWNTMSEKGTSLAQYVEHFGLEILNHGDTYETDKVESTNVNRPDLQILGPVSYTHLDVYKRQVPPCLRRLRRPG